MADRIFFFKRKFRHPSFTMAFQAEKRIIAETVRSFCFMSNGTFALSFADQRRTVNIQKDKYATKARAAFFITHALQSFDKLTIIRRIIRVFTGIKNTRSLL